MLLTGQVTIDQEYYLEMSSSASNQLMLGGDTILISTHRTITNSNDTGFQGEICYDANYMYVCVSDNLWKRIALNVW